MRAALRKRALERRLRESGASRSEARAAVALGWRVRWVAAVSPRAFLALVRWQFPPKGLPNG